MHAQADALKEQGNRQFEQRAFRDALKLYTKAISIAPDVATYYGNRAAAWFMLDAFRECIADCQQAVLLDKGYAKGYVRMAKAMCALGVSTRGRAGERRAEKEGRGLVL